MNWREFHFKKGSKIQVWKIAIATSGDEYFTQYGQKNGKMQEFTDRPGDKGKVGTEAYVDSVANTLFHVSREIRKKEEHGYVEIDADGNQIKQQITSIDWNQLLPKNFCGYKPQTEIADKKLELIFNKKMARFSRKYDGHCHYAAHHPWGWEIYTRRMDLATERFPNHIINLNKLTHLGPGTILSGEMTSFDNYGMDNFKNVSRVCRSLPEEARKLIDSKEIPEPVFVIYDVIFHNYKSLEEKSYDERSKLWMMLLPPKQQNLISRVEYFNLTPSTWMQMAKNNKWEGFVVADGSSIPGKKFFSFSGKAERPLGHHKLKAVYTEDAIMCGAIYGSGKYQDTIGALLLKQRWPEDHEKAGEYFFCGKAGSGLDDESRADLVKECIKNNVPIFNDEKDMKEELLSDSGITVELEYSDRQPGTQKFKFPVFLRTRIDKAPQECYAQRLSEE